MKTFHMYDYNGKTLAFEPDTMTPFEADELAKKAIRLIEERKDEDEIVWELSAESSEEEVRNLFQQLDSIGNPSEDEMEKAKARRRITVWLQVSHDCNLRCKYCFAGTGEFHGDREMMSWDTAKAACDYLIKRYEKEAEVLVIVFFGGEPMMNIPVIKKVYEYFASKSHTAEKPVMFTISSNGTLANEGFLEYLAEKDIGIMFSIDGPKEVQDRYRPFPDGSGSYDVTMANAVKFLEYRDSRLISIEATYSHEDYDLVKRVREFRAKGFGFIKLVSVQLPPGHPLRFTEADLPGVDQAVKDVAVEYLSELKNGQFYMLEPFSPIMKTIAGNGARKERCKSAVDDLAIAADGKIYPCTRLSGLDEWVIGDVYNGLIDENTQCWKDTRPYTSREGCSDCWIRNICGGGCRVDSIEHHGNLIMPDAIHCEIFKSYARAALWIMSELDEEVIQKII